jgi:hypothetical protein
MVSRWMPVTRSVERIEEPSVRRDRQSVALAGSIRIRTQRPGRDIAVGRPADLAAVPDVALAIVLRFEAEQLEMVDRAAEQAGLNRTSWLRALAIRAAREELGEMSGQGRGKRHPCP